MSSSESPLNFPFQRLRDVRTAILRLHKALLDSEKVVYEKHHGKIRSKGEFFQLVVSGDWFSWLRPFSQYIVKVDETLSSKEPATLEEVNELLEEARSLVKPAEEGTDTQKRYYEAIQRDPNIALMHAEVSDLLRHK